MRHNLTVTIDEDLLRDARKVALDQRTSVNQLVRNYLEQLVRESSEREKAKRDMEELFAERPFRIGNERWTRDELHER